MVQEHAGWCAMMTISTFVFIFFVFNYSADQSASTDSEHNGHNHVRSTETWASELLYGLCVLDSLSRSFCIDLMDRFPPAKKVSLSALQLHWAPTMCLHANIARQVSSCSEDLL